MDLQQARQLAQDETTPPEKLRELANSTGSMVLKNIVANPNIPPDVLSRLAAQFPKQVFNNPALDLLLLETPDLFSGKAANVLCSLLKREAPIEMVKYAANSSDERLKLSLLMNTKISPEILKQLSQSKSYQVQETTALHCNSTNKNSTNNYQEFIQAKIQQEELQSDKTYQEILRNISSFIKLDENLPLPIERKKSYPQISLSEVEKLMEQKKSVFDIASNPNISVEIINKLLEFERPGSHDIGWRIAFNPSTPTVILEKLARSNYHTAVHNAIALNQNTPVYILEIILNNPSAMRNYVYAALGRNRKLSDSHFWQLVNKFSDARISVFNNPSASKHLKGKLIEAFKKGVYSPLHKQLISGTLIIPISKDHPHEFVNNLFIPEDFLELCVDEAIIKYQYNLDKFGKKQSSTLGILALHPNITVISLKKLLAHEDRLVRRNAISNCKTPQYITEVLGMSFLENLNRDELKILARNFYATEELLRELVNHKDITVSRTAASNPCSSNKILEEWETSPHYKLGSLGQIMAAEQRLLEEWESSISAANRLIVLLNPEAPIEVLAKISHSASWLERYAIAQNLKTPYLIIQKLADDGNRIVRAAAQTRSQEYLKQAIK